jgi:hypothetical protein
MLQWDCGKLVVLDKLFKRLKAGGHRCRVFTQVGDAWRLIIRFSAIFVPRVHRVAR